MSQKREEKKERKEEILVSFFEWCARLAIKATQLELPSKEQAVGWEQQQQPQFQLGK